MSQLKGKRRSNNKLKDFGKLMQTVQHIFVRVEAKVAEKDIQIEHTLSSRNNNEERPSIVNMSFGNGKIEASALPCLEESTSILWRKKMKQLEITELIKKLI